MDIRVEVPAGLASCVVLDRLVDVPEPAYCVHGEVTCGGCGGWCWLGDRTYELVAAGRVVPLCLRCAGRHVPVGVRVEHVEDHRRAVWP